MKNFGNFGGGEKLAYTAPEIYVERVNCDNGFAGSNEKYNDGSGLSWDDDEE